MSLVGAVGTSPGLVAAFGAGLLSFLSPCVLPLVPGYLSLMSGLTSAEVHEATGAQRRQIALNAALFVLGFSLVFVAYGAVASTLGSLLLQHRRLLTQIAGVSIVVMGLAVAGVLRPSLLLRERRFHVSPSTLGIYAAPVMGMAFAFGWTPCIGPVLAAVLTLAAGRDTLGQGVTLLVAYSIGLGLPFIAAGVALGHLRNSMTWWKRHGRHVDLAAGALLVGFGTLLFASQLGRVSSAVSSLWQSLGLDRLTVG